MLYAIFVTQLLFVGNQARLRATGLAPAQLAGRRVVGKVMSMRVPMRASLEILKDARLGSTGAPVSGSPRPVSVTDNRSSPFSICCRCGYWLRIFFKSGRSGLVAVKSSPS